MELREEQIEGVATLAAQGRLDSFNVAAFRDRLEALAIVPGNRVVLDLSALEYISSAGLNAILGSGKHAEVAGSRLVICGLSGHVRRIFGVAGFLDLFTIVDGRSEAIAAAKAGPPRAR